MKKDDLIFCPLVDKDIDIVDCMENRDIRDDVIPAEYRAKENWKDICAECPYNKF